MPSHIKMKDGHVFYNNSGSYEILHLSKCNSYYVNKLRFEKSKTEIYSIEYHTLKNYSAGYVINEENKLDKTLPYTLHFLSDEEFSSRTLLESDSQIYRVNFHVFYTNANDGSKIIGINDFCMSRCHLENFHELFGRDSFLLKNINISILEKDVLDIAFEIENGEIIHGLLKYDLTSGFKMFPSFYSEKTNLITYFDEENQEKLEKPKKWISLLRNTEYFKNLKEEIKSQERNSKTRKEQLKTMIKKNRDIQN